MAREGHRRCGGDGLGNKEDLEQLKQTATRRLFASTHQQQRRVKEQKGSERRGNMINMRGGWMSGEEAALDGAVSEGWKHEPGPAVRNLHKTQLELGLQLNQPVLKFDAFDPAAQLTDNTRHMLSRLGVGLGGDDDHNTGKTPRHPSDGRANEAERSKWHRYQHQHQHQQQGGGEREEDQQDTWLTENEVDAESVAEDENPRDCGGIMFKGELARAFRVAVQADKRLKRNMAGVLPRALEESRKQQGAAVSSWKKVVLLLHRCLTRTLSENAELLAQKDRLEADLLRTELELEENMALVSSLLDGQCCVAYTKRHIDGSTAAASVNDHQPHHVRLDRQASPNGTSSTGSSTNHEGAPSRGSNSDHGRGSLGVNTNSTGSPTNHHRTKPAVRVPANGDDSDHGQSFLDVNTSGTGSSTDHQGAKPAVGVPANGGDFDPGQRVLDRPPVKMYSSGSNDGNVDTLAGNPVVLSPVSEGSGESRGSDESETSWSALGAEDVASLAAFKALVTKHEASQALQERDRIERISSDRLAHSITVALAPKTDLYAPPSKLTTVNGTTPCDAESFGDDGLSPRCSGSESGGLSYGSSSWSPRAVESPASAAPGIEMTYCLPGKAKNPPSDRPLSADIRSSSAPGRNGLRGKSGHHSRLAAAAPGAGVRNTKPVGEEADPAARVGAVGSNTRIRRESVPATLAAGDPALSTGTRGSDLRRGYVLATRRAARAFDATDACTATGYHPRNCTAPSRKEEPVAGPETTDTLEELDRTRRAIKKDVSDRLSAVMTEHMAAAVAVAQSSPSTAASKVRNPKRRATCGGNDIWSARPLLGRQGAKQPLSNLQINTGYRMTDFFDRSSGSHGGLIGVDTQGSAASTMLFAERGKKIRVATSSGVGRVAAARSGITSPKRSRSTIGRTRNKGIQPPACREIQRRREPSPTRRGLNARLEVACDAAVDGRPSSGSRRRRGWNSPRCPNACLRVLNVF